MSLRRHSQQSQIPTRILSERHLHGLPRVVDPLVADGLSSKVLAAVRQVLGQSTLLLLILVVQDEDGEGGLLAGAAELLGGRLDVLLELAHGVLERGARVVDLVDDQHVLADQVGHLERGQVQPLRARHLGAGRLDLVAGAERLVERKADGLDGDVRAAGLLEEGAARERTGQPGSPGKNVLLQPPLSEAGVQETENGQTGSLTAECGRGRSHRRQWRS